MRPTRHAVRTAPRARPANVKAATIVARGFKNLELAAEAVAEFPYRPTWCRKTYRVVVLRKNISVARGEQRLFDEVRYFFYLTNDPRSAAADVVFLANDRCNQENLIDQLKHGVGRHAHAGRHPGEQLGLHGDGRARLDLKAWFALLLPETGRWATPYRREKRAGAADGIQDVPERLHADSRAGRVHEPPSRSSVCSPGIPGSTSSSAGSTNCTARCAAETTS